MPMTSSAANRTRTPTISPPLNNSPHHLVLDFPDQIVNEPPLLNECRNTNRIGINKNTSTSAVQTPSTLGKTSIFVRVRGLMCFACSRVRACILRLRFCTAGEASELISGTIFIARNPTPRDSNTAAIIKIAIAEPSGQFCAPLNCEAIIAPIMLPFAPPSTVAVT
ncbi:unannotated protein [freshwater metagenome]|uniref:Unannotated protein n=1 Tax=freshwater metagenome TaxID=449393 RepID=A0A6J7KD02_9ZZZZ